MRRHKRCKKTDLTKLIRYLDKRPMKEIFYDAGGIKAQLIYLRAKQVIPPCKMDNDVLFYVIEGKGEITVDNRREKLRAKVSVIVPKEAESRSISAESNLVILAVQCKSGNKNVKNTMRSPRESARKALLSLPGNIKKTILL